MRDLLIALGKRVHDLRAAKGWSQEEFAHVGGLHRTYVGQIERGEKNISFGNLVKLSSVLGVTLPDLVSGLEDRRTPQTESIRRPKRSRDKINPEQRLFEIQRLVKRLGHQRAEMDRTILILEELTGRGGTPTGNASAEHSKNRRSSPCR